jgi:LysR family nitrogen assimilation transcriptional regulator
MVARKRIDIAVLHNPPHLESLNIQPLLAERMLVVGPARDRSKSRRLPASFRVRDLADLPLILPNMAHSNRRLVEHAAHEHGIRLRIKIEADSVAFAKAMVEKGLGYTILTYAAVQDELAARKLVAYPIVRPTISTKVTIVTLRDMQLPRQVRDASSILRDVCCRLVRDKHWVGAQIN